MCQPTISIATSGGPEQYFIVRSEHFNEADSYVVAVFQGVYQSSADAWLKISEIVDDLDTQSHGKGTGKGEFIQDMWLGNIWYNASGYTVTFTITPIDTR